MDKQSRECWINANLAKEMLLTPDTTAQVRDRISMRHTHNDFQLCDGFASQLVEQTVIWRTIQDRYVYQGLKLLVITSHPNIDFAMEK